MMDFGGGRAVRCLRFVFYLRYVYVLYRQDHSYRNVKYVVDDSLLSAKALSDRDVTFLHFV